MRLALLSKILIMAATNTNNVSAPARTKTVHVVCIGGSGLRVLRSFIMLLSSGYDIPGYIVRPYIVDPHLQSTDLKFATELITKYNALQSNDNSGFVKAPLYIESLDNLNVMKVDDTFAKLFGDFIGYREMGNHTIEQNIVDMLYNNINIEKSMNVGFKGSPNVGSVVFQDFINGSWFQHNFANLTSNDKVILVGSLFGGTGASGIPAIAKALKAMNLNIEVAAIALTPYFKLKKPDPTAVDKEIDSDIFDIKSLAALNFYKQNNPGIDNFYIVGDSDSKDYDYDELNQGNSAHFIEMVAATAVKHFAVTDKSSNNQWNMFFTEDLQPTMLYDHCGAGLHEVLECLANFYAFSKFFMMMRKDVFYPFNKKFYKRISKGQTAADQFKALDDLIYNEDPDSDSFIRWMGELRDNVRSFNAVNTFDIKSPSGQRKEYRFEPKTPNVVFNGTVKLNKVNMSDYFLTINNAYRASQKTTDQINDVAKFLNIAHTGIKEVNSK